MTEHIDTGHIVTGLTAGEVARRVAEGKTNVRTDPPTKSVGQIVCSHLFTLFNAVNFALAALVVVAGSYRNLLFMGVVLSNIAVGVFQEIRAKRTIDRLTLITAPGARVVRDGAERQIAVDELVLDDVVVLTAGNQITADAVVGEGELEVNEALLTGEADPILKRRGDALRSGSFVVAGHGRAVVEHVGADNYVAKITERAKQLRKPHSALMQAIGFIIKVVSIAIVPMGLLMFAKQFLLLERGFSASVVATTSAVIGMIPEGLVLLTSISLAVGVIKLASRRTLVQEMYSIESLARADVLCLDKTGTITEGSMKLEGVIALDADFAAEPVLAALAHAVGDANATAEAIRIAYPETPGWTAEAVIPFSSARKYSAVRFACGGYALGAPEILLADGGASLVGKTKPLAASGKRVLCLCRARVDDRAASDCDPVALVVLSDRVRADAAETLAYFRRQDVAVKIISGDACATVAAVAREAGLEVEGCVDLAGRADGEVAALAEGNNVFGRVSPQQKCVLVDALKSAGHTVAMTGDGVNDVLALKNADCSIAMAAGSDAARVVSQLVLLDSSFSSLPQVVAEGRRVVNNIRRAASLYLVKTVYSTLLSIVFLCLNVAWPFVPIQITLIGAVTVGIPSFILALEPNDERVRGNFLRYVFFHAIPGALAICLTVVGLVVTSAFVAMTHAELSTLCALATGIVGFIVLYNVCQPFNIRRALLFGVMFAGFVACVLFFGSLFVFEPIPVGLLPVLLAACIVAAVLVALFTRLTEAAIRRFSDRSRTNRKKNPV